MSLAYAQWLQICAAPDLSPPYVPFYVDLYCLWMNYTLIYYGNPNLSFLDRKRRETYHSRGLKECKLRIDATVPV